MWNFIEERISNDETTTWISDTVIDNTVETYDVDGNINAYIFNLKIKKLTGRFHIWRKKLLW